MGGPAHHEPFKSLSPLSWTSDLSSGTDPDILSQTIADAFSNAQILIDSLSVSPSTTTTTAKSNLGRARSQTESATATVDSNHILPTPETKNTIEKLRKEWKEVKTNPRDNPHGIAVYKLGSKDGKGSWFGRCSLHRGQDFGEWEGCLRREFRETLERAEREGRERGCGNIRGIGAERVVERVETGEGLMEVFQVSARFGGPTTARDFIALHITPPARTGEDGEKKKKGARQPRQFMLVSRPVEHPDCPPRSGFIRGVYESVEVIREVPVVKPLRRTKSSGDWGEYDGKDGKEAAIRSTKKAIEEVQDSEEEDAEMAIEWLMVTRSDPGGSVPRFMVEKGTPGGIINDAGQFLKWFASQQALKDGEETINGDKEVDGQAGDKVGEKKAAEKETNGSVDSSVLKQLRNGDQNGETHDHTQGQVTPPSGFYGMIASALGAAGSAVASRVATLAGSTIATDDDSIDDEESDTSSELSFASASEGHGADDDVTAELEKNDSNIDVASALSSVSPSSLHSNEDGSSVAHTSHSASLSHQQAQHDKELKKLQDRMRKAQDKLERSHQRRHHNHHKEQDEAKEEAALQRLKEKHEREIAKQKEKYEREVSRLAEKKQQEEKKKEEKRRKQVEREEKADMAMELERTRAGRDVARKEIEILRGQVGELQRENTMLVARLGKLGVGVGDI